MIRIWEASLSRMTYHSVRSNIGLMDFLYDFVFRCKIVVILAELCSLRIFTKISATLMTHLFTRGAFEDEMLNYSNWGVFPLSYDVSFNSIEYRLDGDRYMILF